MIMITPDAGNLKFNPAVVQRYGFWPISDEREKINERFW